MQSADAKTVSFNEAFRFWLKLGLISFGGPAGQIAVMQRELVENKRWIDQDDFLHALNYCLICFSRKPRLLHSAARMRS